MAAPDLAAFRARARSSPWRWRTVRLVVAYAGDRVEHPRPVQALVHRPHGLRVEELDGAPVTASWSEHPWGAGWDDDGAGPVERTMHGPQDARPAAPELRADGLVARRPAQTRHLRYDDPMLQTYRWVAMLDPDGVHSRARDRWEQGLAGQPDPDRRQRALSHRVRLDVGTGILVLSQEEGGDADGRGWHASIEDVDADLPRSAFG